MKPRFQAECEVSNEELCILTSWFLSPMNKNNEELRVRRLAVIQEDYLLKSILKVANTSVKVEWVEREELSVICIKVVVKGKGSSEY